MEARILSNGEALIAFSLNAVGLYSLEIIVQGRSLPGRVLLEVVDSKELLPLKVENGELSEGFQTKSTFKISHSGEASAFREQSLAESAKTEKQLEKKKLKPVQKEISNAIFQKGGKVNVRYRSNQAKKMNLDEKAPSDKIGIKIEQIKKIMNNKPGLLESFLKSKGSKVIKNSKLAPKYSKES